MTTTTPAWPAPAAPLTPAFDADRLAHELAAVTAHEWQRQRTHYAAGRIGPDTPTDWRVLPLRSPGGDPTRTDPGGPGPDHYAATRWLDQMPYLREILDEIPAPLNAVRLLALGPGAASQPHRDPKYALERGMVRLHIPIVTHPGAVLVLDGTEHRWQPGTSGTATSPENTWSATPAPSAGSTRSSTRCSPGNSPPCFPPSGRSRSATPTSSSTGCPTRPSARTHRCRAP
ncbi:aspartyl/asparaginyl beta-hydroxylase domain-containing protein [Streptomyces sp. NPDC059340]|uniref:aspartyl/asparaginyl beta-hydroxylase domain-containing protein n=1 Tax=Streptomyces sp. NPDC059340 TaxID=3346806 RepID=UPI00368BC5EB